MSVSLADTSHLISNDQESSVFSILGHLRTTPMVPKTKTFGSSVISRRIVSSSQLTKLSLLPIEIGIYLTQLSVTHHKP